MTRASVRAQVHDSGRLLFECFFPASLYDTPRPSELDALRAEVQCKVKHNLDPSLMPDPKRLTLSLYMTTKRATFSVENLLLFPQETPMTDRKEEERIDREVRERATLTPDARQDEAPDVSARGFGHSVVTTERR